MKFSHDLTYDASPAQVRAMLADPAFREQACEAMHASRREVSIQEDGTGMTVLVDQTQPARGLPGFAKSVVGDEMRIVQRESWTDEGAATLSIEIPGKPGRFDGSITLVGDGAGTRETVAGEVRVKLPLLGGKLEGLVGDVLRSALEAEQRVGRSWLAGQAR